MKNIDWANIGTAADVKAAAGEILKNLKSKEGCWFLTGRACLGAILTALVVGGRGSDDELHKTLSLPAVEIGRMLPNGEIANFLIQGAYSADEVLAAISLELEA